MANIATFTVTLNTPSTVPVLVDYTTVDETAVSYVDYVIQQGTLTFQPSVTTATVVVNIISASSGLETKTFKLLLSNPRAATLETTPESSECTISTAPPIMAVPFPGRRMAALGDSITYANIDAPLCLLFDGNDWLHRLRERYPGKCLRA